MAFFRSRGARRVLWGGAVLAGLALVGGSWIALGLLSDLPTLTSIDDYRPPVTSRVLDRNGRIIGEFYVERRSVIPMEEIPHHTRMAFVAAEDGKFFEHGGIDFVSIARAAWVDVTEGRIKQGGSTITMQLVKQLLLSTERTFERKFREMILARELEQSFTKNEILWLYLNQIYFGQGAWGIEEAARTYFDKPAIDLSLSESALLAGLPQRPSQYSPVRNPALAEKRRRYVLQRLLGDRVISRSEYELALADLPELAKARHREDFAAAAYFSEEVRRDLYEQLGSEAVLQGGLIIETTLDLEFQKAAVAAVRSGLEAHDRRQGYRGPLRQVDEAEIENEIERLAEENGLELAASEDEVQAARQLPGGVPLLGIVVGVDDKQNRARVAFGPGIEGEVELADVSWAREPNPRRLPYSLRKIKSVFKTGDVTHFEVIEGEDSQIASAEANGDGGGVTALPRVGLFQPPLVQGALLSLDVASGEVLAMVGGYEYQGSEFNRVTQARRQPGSAFKPFIYGAALAQDYSPVTTLWDRPVVYEDPTSGFVWRPQNYGREFYGPVPMRRALVKSINNATVHLFRDVGVDYVIDFSRRLGIQAPFQRDLSLALGSSGVSLLEIVTAYAVFPNHGQRVAPHYIRKVTNRDGEIVLEDVFMGEPPPPVYETLVATTDDADAPASDEVPADERIPTDQVITEQAAFLMCDLLKGVVFDPDGTGKRLRELRRPVAGKTGTTNNQADAWFVGFSPDIATGVWVGYDEELVLGRGETGSRAASPIWVDYMRTALKGLPSRDFEVPEGIVFQRIDRETGLVAGTTDRNSYFQPFLENTEPTMARSAISTATDTRRALRDDAF